MKLTCLQEKLDNALNLVQRAVGKNVNLPILSNIMLKTEKGRLKVAATDLEIGIETWITSKVEEEGEITVPAQTFSNFVSSLPKGKIKIITEDNNLKAVSSKKMKAEFNGLDPGEFPIIPEVENDTLFEMSGKTLAQGLAQVQPACSFSDTRPEISGVFFTQGDEKKLKLAATDSFRLAEKTIKTKNELDSDLGIIIPLDTVKELTRAVKSAKTKVSCKIKDNQIEFSFKDSRIISRLIEGDFPEYQRIIPDDFATKVVLKRNKLQEAVQRASFFSSKINDVRIEIEAGKVQISARSQKVGKNVSILEANNEGEKMSSVFNYNYLLDGLKSIQTEKVILNFSGDEQPVLLKPFKDRSFLYLVMPIKDVGKGS